MYGSYHEGIELSDRRGWERKARPYTYEDLKISDEKRRLEESMKPCPFCGAVAAPGIYLHVEEIWRGSGRQAKCYGCGATGPTESTHAQAVESWNKPARTG